MARPARTQKARQQTERSRTQESKRGRERARQRSNRVKKAADYCADVITDSWQGAVANRATEYIDAELWNRLFRSRRKKHCHTLAQMAAAILTGKDLMHAILGAAGGWVARVLGANKLEQTIVKDLASKILLPTDAKMVAVARGIQLTGILLCLASEHDLTTCQCFIDLAHTETKRRIKNILADAVNNWAGLAQHPSATTTTGAP